MSFSSAPKSSASSSGKAEVVWGQHAGWRKPSSWHILEEIVAWMETTVQASKCRHRDSVETPDLDPSACVERSPGMHFPFDPSLRQAQNSSEPQAGSTGAEQAHALTGHLLRLSCASLFFLHKNPPCTPKKELGHFVFIPHASHLSSVGSSIISSLLLWPSEDSWLALISRALIAHQILYTFTMPWGILTYLKN